MSRSASPRSGAPHPQGRLLPESQLQGAEPRRRRRRVVPGLINFGNDTNNPLDTGFGYANAALGIFTSYQQQSKFVEGSFLYNQIDWFVQDNWKVNSRLTLDYGLRFVHQQPQYDQYLQSSNFFPDRWSPSAAPPLYVPGCAGRAPARAPAGRRATR